MENQKISTINVNLTTELDSSSEAGSAPLHESSESSLVSSSPTKLIEIPSSDNQHNHHIIQYLQITLQFIDKLLEKPRLVIFVKGFSLVILIVATILSLDSGGIKIRLDLEVSPPSRQSGQIDKTSAIHK